MLFSAPTFAQFSGILGTVVDEKGEPVIGATVVERGQSQNATITNIDGQFAMKVPEGTVLVVSYIGFQSQEVVAKNQMTVTLKEDAQVLTDVVVIGYGVQKKSVVTASIAKVSTSDLEMAAPMRVDNALKGLVSGVQVTQASGQPGSGAKIRIRGNGTINNSDPLYIVDGMPLEGGIDYLNPQDIESIEVLKDAASCAVYGTRGANGVVLVTTKSGKLGKVKVTYDVSFGWQNPWRKRQMLNAAEYTELMKEAAAYAGKSDIDQLLTSFGNSDTDWQKELFNDNAPVQNHVVSMSGANERVNYFLSFGYYDSEGIVGGDYGRSDYKRMSLRSNSTYTVFDESKERNWLKNMKIGANVGYSRIKSHSIETNNLTGSALGNAMFLPPLMSVYPTVSDEEFIKSMEGRATADELIYDKKSGRLLNVPSTEFNEISNPFAYLSTPGELYNGDKFVGNFFAELGLWDNLTFRSSYGVDLAFWGDDSWTYPYYLNKNATSTQSWAQSDMHRQLRWQVENVLSYNKEFGDHAFSVVLGQSATKLTGRNLWGQRYDLTAYDGSKANIDFATGLASDGKQFTTGGLYSPSTLASYFARLSYNYAERYMLQATVRRDGSSKFGPNNKWATFPSVSLGWNATNEPFMEKRPDWFTNLKVRLSWGKNGNENIDAFAYTANVAMGNNYAFGAGGNDPVVLGSKPDKTANPDLKWEESEQYDAGVDFGFFGNALTLTVDVFKKKTNGMLKEMTIPTYLGESLPIGNVGDMENKGIEIEAGYKFSVSDVNIRIGGNISYLKNKLIKLGTASGFDTDDNVHQIGNVTAMKDGEVFPYFYGFKTAGIFQSDAEAEAYVNAQGERLLPQAKAGDVIFVDVNGDGKIDNDDRTKIGKGDPDWTYGFNLSANWRGFDFSMLWAGTIGNDIFNATRRTDIPYVNLPHEFMDRWTPENHSNSMPRFEFTSANQNYRASDLYIEDGSYLRLKNVQLGYTLPQTLTQKVFVNSLRLYVQAENLSTITGYNGFEPEISYGRQSGIDRGYYPQPRTITVGANIAF